MTEIVTCDGPRAHVMRAQINNMPVDGYSVIGADKMEPFMKDRIRTCTEVAKHMGLVK